MAKTKSKAERRRIGRLSRNKGKVGEREVATSLRELFGPQVRRGWQARDGADAPDIEGTPFWVEVKRGRPARSVGVAVRQAVEAAGRAKDVRRVLVVAREDRQEAIVGMTFETWLAWERTFKEKTERIAALELELAQTAKLYELARGGAAPRTPEATERVLEQVEAEHVAAAAPVQPDGTRPPIFYPAQPPTKKAV